MTDPDRSSEAADLDERLRAGMRAVVAEAPEAPPFPGGADAPFPAREHRPRSMALAGIAALVVLVAVVVAVAAAGHHHGTAVVTATRPSSSASTPPSTRPSPTAMPLAGTEWRMVAVEHDGVTATVPAVGPAQGEAAAAIRFAIGPDCSATSCTDTRMSGSDGCNSFSGPVTIDRGVVTPADIGGTLVACSGGAVWRTQLLTPSVSHRFRVTVTGTHLRVAAADGDRFGFEAASDPFGAPRGTVIQVGTHGALRYRFSWYRYSDASPGGSPQPSVGLDFQSSTGPGQPPGDTGIGTASNGIDLRRTVDVVADPLGDTERFVLGFAPPGTVKVTFLPGSGAPARPLALHQLPGVSVVAIGGIVAGGSGSYAVIAQDASGHVIATAQRGA